MVRNTDFVIASVCCREHNRPRLNEPQYASVVCDLTSLYLLAFRYMWITAHLKLQQNLKKNVANISYIRHKKPFLTDDFVNTLAT